MHTELMGKAAYSQATLSFLHCPTHLQRTRLRIFSSIEPTRCVRNRIIFDESLNRTTDSAKKVPRERGLVWYSGNVMNETRTRPDWHSRGQTQILGSRRLFVKR